MTTSRRVCLVDPCRFTRSALTQLLQRRGMLVESLAVAPQDPPANGRWDWLVIFSESGQREDAVQLVRPTGPRITLSRDAISVSLLLRILEGDEAGAPSLHAGPGQGPMLTDREQEVLRALAGGSSSREIAERLGISPKTVDNHKASIYAKLGVQSQAQAVATAVRGGLIQADRRGA